MTNDLLLDRAGGRLFRGGGQFDIVAHCWTDSRESGGQPVGLPEALRWLQTESGTPCRPPVALIGPREAKPEERNAAFAMGRGLASLGLVLLCSGKGGVMEAACEGAASAGGCSVGLLPDADWEPPTTM